MESSLIRAIVVTVAIVIAGIAINAWVPIEPTIKRILWIIGSVVILIVWLVWLFGILGVTL